MDSANFGRFRSWRIGVRIVCPHKSGVGKFWPSSLLEMISVIGVCMSGQGLCSLGIMGRETYDAQNNKIRKEIVFLWIVELQIRRQRLG
jgi:hypothetical protein